MKSESVCVAHFRRQELHGSGPRAKIAPKGATPLHEPYAMRSIPNSSNSLAIRVLHWVEWLVLVLIAVATLVAIGQEMVLMVYQRAVMMHNILLLFIFLEILTMVGLYFQSGKLPIRYPLYIAMVSIARYITISSMTDMDGWTTIGLSIALLVLAMTVLVIRYGHIHLPYDEE